MLCTLGVGQDKTNNDAMIRETKGQTADNSIRIGRDDYCAIFAVDTQWTRQIFHFLI